MSGMRELAAKCAALLKKYWRKILVLIIGQGLWRLVSWTFDNGIYPVVVAKLGVVLGGIIMTFASFCICMGMMVHYRNKKVEWLGWDDAIDSLHEKIVEFQEALNLMLTGRILMPSFAFVVLFSQDIRQNLMIFMSILLGTQFFIFLLKCLKVKFWGDIIAFLALSILEDPFMTTAYLRHGKTEGITKKDFYVLVASIAVGNGYWILRTVVFIEIVKYSWHLLF